MEQIIQSIVTDYRLSNVSVDVSPWMLNISADENWSHAVLMAPGESNTGWYKDTDCSDSPFCTPTAKQLRDCGWSVLVPPHTEDGDKIEYEDLPNEVREAIESAATKAKEMLKSLMYREVFEEICNRPDLWPSGDNIEEIMDHPVFVWILAHHNHLSGHGKIAKVILNCDICDLPVGSKSIAKFKNDASKDPDGLCIDLHRLPQRYDIGGKSTCIMEFFRNNECIVATPISLKTAGKLSITWLVNVIMKEQDVDNKDSTRSKYVEFDKAKSQHEQYFQLIHWFLAKDI